MKYFYFGFFAYFLCVFSAFGDDIHYGYNAQGEYVPMQIDGQRVHYGYNAHGDYVPMQIGDDSVQYGYNAQGDYVPTAVGNAKIDYGYNAQGNYVPTSVGVSKNIISVLGAALSGSTPSAASSASDGTLFPNYNSKTKKWNHSWGKGW